MTSPFIAPRYEVPIADQATGRISLEWYKFLVPLAKKAVPSTLTVDTTGPLTGGGPLDASLTLTISANGVTNAFLGKMATDTFKGNATGGLATPQDLSTAQATALLDVFTDALKGLAPSSGGGANNLLRSDGTWVASVGGSFGAGTYLKTGAVLVAALPAAATAGAGARMFVTDATATTFHSIVAGTGANAVPVVSDGTNWLIG